MSDLINIVEMSKDHVNRNMNKKVDALVNKWDGTGLLAGLKSIQEKKNMATLLENQLKWIVTQGKSLLNEANDTSDIIGFQNVAFPIVRRVFGGLIANELVSVQPMSLPSGLLFYMDYTYGTVKSGNKKDGFTAGGSLYGDQVAPGVENLATNGYYNLGTSYSQREIITTVGFSASFATASEADIDYDPDLSASLGNGDGFLKKLTLNAAYASASGYTTYAADLTSYKNWVPVSASSTATSTTADGTPVQIGGLVWVARRHTKIAGNNMTFIISSSLNGTNGLYNAFNGTFGGPGTEGSFTKLAYVHGTKLTGGTSGTIVTPGFETDFGATPLPTIPEIDISIKSAAVIAQPRKLRAKWSPELAQDLNAYHAMDAEVELTQVLSEAIALEVDREVLSDLLVNGTGGTRYWSRKPGKFVDKLTGLTASGASFTGTIQDWYQGLIETITDLANTIHKKTLRGAANFAVVSPDVATILESTVSWKPIFDASNLKATQMSVGIEKIGTAQNRYTIYKDPYFPVNKILVGFKGSTFLETGYVYAPYVPLIVTPTIFHPEDFSPRKGVMTRYAKKMVRSDFYGSVVVEDMNII